MNIHNVYEWKVKGINHNQTGEWQKQDKFNNTTLYTSRDMTLRSTSCQNFCLNIFLFFIPIISFAQNSSSLHQNSRNHASIKLQGNFKANSYQQSLQGFTRYDEIFKTTTSEAIFMNDISSEDEEDGDWESNTTTRPLSGDRSCDPFNSQDNRVVISYVIFLVFSLLFLFFGLVGNGISLLVFSSRSMLKISSNVYLLHLAISDSVYLVSVFCRKTFKILQCWHYIHLAFDLSNHSSAGCILTQFFMDLSSDCSSVFILLFTIERFFAVYWPLSFKQICTVKRARLLCFFFFAIILISTTPPHVLLIRLNSTYHICSLAEEKSDKTFLFVLEMVVYRAFPAIAISFLNAFIVYKVAKINNLKKKLKNKAGNVENTTVNDDKKNIEMTEACVKREVEERSCYNINDRARKVGYVDNENERSKIEDNPLHGINKEKSELTKKSAETNRTRALTYKNYKKSSKSSIDINFDSKPSAIFKHRISKQSNQPNRKRREDKNRQLTITLILVSTTYILAFIPSLCFYISNWMEYFKYLTMHKNTRRIVSNYTDLLYVSAFANNFFLFTLSGKLFRQQIKLIFCGQARSNTNFSRTR